MSMRALFLAYLAVVGGARGEIDGGGGEYSNVLPTTIWPDDGTNDQKCAGHRTKSKSCGANSKKYGLECCPGLACEGKLCVVLVNDVVEDAEDAEGDTDDQHQPMTATKDRDDQQQEGTNHTADAMMLELEKVREELEQKRREEEELRRKQAEEQERIRQQAAEVERRRKQAEAERLRIQREEEERLRREEFQRQKEAKAQRPEEKKALIRLYEETGGDDWSRKGGWLEDNIDQCLWEGIACNEYGLVLDITLPQNNMVGTIPNLPELQHLEVIDMHANSLEAVLPIRVDYPALRFVSLAKNKLRGTLSSISYRLEHLDLSSNEIEGRFEPWFDLDALCPSESPSSAPSLIPSSIPSDNPSALPSSLPSSGPSFLPTFSNVSRVNGTISSMNSTYMDIIPTMSNVDVNASTTTREHMIEEAIESAANMANNDTELVENITDETSEDKNDERKLPVCGAKLRHLSLGDNRFEQINLSELTSLQYVDLSRNKYMNQSLASLGLNQLKHVETLNLGESYRVSGDLRIGHMQLLKNLDLNGMKLGGALSKTGILDITTLSTINLSGGNDFHGEFYFCNHTELEAINLGGNRLQGDLTSCDLSAFKSCDLSDNNYSGSLRFGGAPSRLLHLNLHRNAFTGSLPSFRGLSGLTSLHLGENAFTGSIPHLDLPSLRSLNISFNEITGTIPSSISKLRLCDTIDLSHQARSEYFPSTGQRVTRGIGGKIPPEVGELSFLQRLFLANNLLTSTLPDSVAQLTYLRLIDVENNLLSGQIPSSINILEQLGTVKLAHNQLTGDIPDLGGSQETVRTVTMAGNPGLSSPAPFVLCDLEDLDLRSDPKYCPSDRSALAAFYTSTKGSEWLVNTNWMSPVSHCLWYGVTCSPDGEKTLKLELVANGVAGQLPDEFFEIRTLTHLDLTDNDIRGAIPPLIKEFRDLQYLRLSYNRLTSVPDEIEFLKNLSLVHLHANRLEGNANKITLVEPPEDLELPPHRFISDCGDPQDVSDAFVCPGCDMCCNALEECQVPHRRKFTATEATAILVGGVFAAICLAWILLRLLVLKKKLKESDSFAIKAAGEESVYSFFLSKSRLGWFIASGTISVQILVFALFLSAASFDNDDGDFVYSWRCPLNTPECNDERAVGAFGWVMWAFLVVFALLDDFVNGIKLIFLSASRGSTPAFFTGMSLSCLTALAIYSSLFYNIAIAMTNTELIVNAVILLFVNDVDEQVYSIVSICSGKAARKLSDEAEEYSAIILDQHLNDQRRKSTIDLIRQARFTKARSTEARTLSPSNRRRLWRGRMGNCDEDILVRIGSGDLFSIGSHDGSVFSGGRDSDSPVKGIALNEGDLLHLVVSLKQRVEELERNVGASGTAAAAANSIRYNVETESVQDEPSLAVAFSEEDSIEIPHVSL